MNEAYPSQTQDQFNLRLPAGWRGVLKAEAKKEHRSMNAEIVLAIQTAMRIKGVNLENAA